MVTKKSLVIFKQMEPHSQQRIHLETGPGGLEIKPEGYGDYSSAPGYGCPIFLEYYEGELRLTVWANINKEDPTHVIDLGCAHEGARFDDDDKEDHAYCDECDTDDRKSAGLQIVFEDRADFEEAPCGCLLERCAEGNGVKFTYCKGHLEGFKLFKQDQDFVNYVRS